MKEEQSFFNEQKKIIFHNKQSLSFIPNNLNNIYGVVLDFGENKIHYELVVKYMGHVNPDVFRIKISRKQIYINNQQPSIKLYELADMMAKAIYPVVLDINNDKKIHSIANHKRIQERSADTCDKISQYFVGEFADNYIRLFQKQVKNPNILINHLENELFYQLFFMPVHGIYDDNLSKKAQYRHISNRNKKTVYDLKVKLNENYSESGKIVAKVVSDEMIDGKNAFEAQYRFYPEDHSIYSMTGNFIIFDDKNQKNNTYFEIYHINPEERQVKKNIFGYLDSIIINEHNKKASDMPKKKKSFWDFFK